MCWVIYPSSSTTSKGTFTWGFPLLTTTTSTTTFATDESLIPPKCPPIFARGNTKSLYEGATQKLTPSYTANRPHYSQMVSALAL